MRTEGFYLYLVHATEQTNIFVHNLRKIEFKLNAMNGLYVLIEFSQLFTVSIIRDIIKSSEVKTYSSFIIENSNRVKFCFVKKMANISLYHESIYLIYIKKTMTKTVSVIEEVSISTLQDGIISDIIQEEFRLLCYRRCIVL